MRVYLSSTFEDLERHRASAAQAIRRLGHQVIQMEDYGAANMTPLQKVVGDVRGCDAFVGVYAWRRGSVPQKSDQANAPHLPGATLGESSFTEWELAAARQAQNTVLLFILEENAPWPPHFIEGLEKPKQLDRVRAFRDDIRRSQLVAYFRTPEDLEQKVATSLAASETTRQLQLFLIAPAVFNNERGFSLESSDLGGITEELSTITSRVVANSSQRTIKINLSTGWWSTRIFLLAFIAERLTRIRRILITENINSAQRVEEQFVGLLPTETAVSTLGSLHPQLAKFVAKAAPAVAPSINITTDIEGLMNIWHESFPAKKPETDIAQMVSAEDLSRWFGHALLRRALAVRDVERPTPLELALVMNYPHEFVPVEWNEEPNSSEKPDPTSAPARRFDVVDQSELSQRIAQRFVSDQLGQIASDTIY